MIAVPIFRRTRTTLILVVVWLITILLWSACSIFLAAVHTSHPGHVMVGAAKYGDAKLVKELLALGVEPEFRSDGNTSLQVARQGGYTEIVKLLQAAGAKE